LSRSLHGKKLEDIEAGIKNYDTDAAHEGLAQLAKALNIQLGKE